MFCAAGKVLSWDDFLSPLAGLSQGLGCLPTACAVGFILSPLCGVLEPLSSVMMINEVRPTKSIASHTL